VTRLAPNWPISGREHRVVKIFYEPSPLAASLAAEGWSAQVAGTRWFILGSAHLDRGV
jgi:hypothetical protein